MTIQPHHPRTVRLAGIATQLIGQVNAQPGSIVARALALIDGERVSSAPSIIRSYAQQVDHITDDRDLSDTGKRSRIEAAASSRVGNIARIAREVVELEAEHEAAKAVAVRLDKPDPADMLLDLALAAHVKAQEPIPTKLVAMSERIRVAVARLPVELSGITPETQSRVVGSLVSPALAAQFQEEAEVLTAARNIVQSAIDEVAPSAGWKPVELVQHFGSAWRLPGITGAGAANMAAELAESGD